MGIEQKIDSSILNLYRLMPSSGEWPFTVLRIDGKQLSGLPFENTLAGASQVLVLKRTDFKREHIMDYAQNSKEFDTIPPLYRTAFVDSFTDKFNDPRELEQWTDNITSMGIGMILHMARSNGLELVLIQAVLSDLDSHLDLEAKGLKAYQLFDVISKESAQLDNE